MLSGILAPCRLLGTNPLGAHLDSFRIADHPRRNSALRCNKALFWRPPSGRNNTRCESGFVYTGKFMRRTKSCKRGSERKSSNRGSVFSNIIHTARSR
jgi:hypothetical protein